MTPAIVLRTTPVGESDLMVVLLTAAQGRVDARASGARRSKRRFAGGLPMGARGFATLALGRGLPRLEAFEMTHDAQVLGRDLEAFAYAAYGCELTAELVDGPLPDPRVFGALAEYLAEVSGSDMEAAPGLGRTPWAMRRFELRLLDALGFLATFDRCAVCGASLVCSAAGAAHAPARDRPSEGIPFDRGRGGPLCARHAGAAPQVDVWALRTAERLRGGLSQDAATSQATDPAGGSASHLLAALAQAPSSARRDLRDLVAGIVRAHLRRPLRSAEFFAQLQRTAPPSPSPHHARGEHRDGVPASVVEASAAEPPQRGEGDEPAPEE